MKISLKDVSMLKHGCDAMILLIDDAVAPEWLMPLNEVLKGGIVRALGADIRPGRGECAVIHTMGAVKALRVILVGLDEKESDAHEALRCAGGRAMKAARGVGATRLAIVAEGALVDVEGVSAFIEGMLLSRYSYTRYKAEESGRAPVKSLDILAPKTRHSGLGGAIREREAVVRGVSLARDLVNTPARDMTPDDLLKAARGIKGLKVKCIEAGEARKLGMNAYLSVADGSHRAPKFIVASYEGGRRGEAPVALVGKSITFDSGGLSLKPGESMERMKYDMAGGAAVLGAMSAIATLGLKINVTGVLPATENLPGGNASKPGDVVRAINGTTIEILNTDAEGRLALADALGYAEKYLKPREIIDLATLTGACVVAFGEEAMAMFASSDELARDIEAASLATRERVWRMPIYREYGEYMRSEIADLRNISRGRIGGLASSGYFLSRFVEKTPWAHLDIAGTAWSEKDRAYSPAGATGVGVRLLVERLKGMVASGAR